ncbi:hypothetical protein PIB30_025050 [Stylosanthes scabra]|uniref:Uncharacterized protein n=1 Tax=Stylosanthes scabra TaxID=79078 RepID=A0ABU6S9F3_9FABA|nr:hypothetical protein [Stylosanthes scabra]
MKKWKKSQRREGRNRRSKKGRRGRRLGKPPLSQSPKLSQSLSQGKSRWLSVLANPIVLSCLFSKSLSASFRLLFIVQLVADIGKRLA